MVSYVAFFFFFFFCFFFWGGGGGLYLVLISPSFSVLVLGLCFMILAFLGYIHLFYTTDSSNVILVQHHENIPI